ncbi:MAG: hypothetical protein Q8O40_15445, partial [Chloroflexota bacterium]|nr:hypothetical protein [Chloroflexota bacterium]
KAYTTGQQPIAAGLAKPAQVLGSALVWLLLSAAAAVPMAIYGTQWVWLPWSLAAACTFWYSWGKQHYMCEAALGLGFGSFAVMFGAATVPDGLGLFGVAFLAGLPFTFLWSYAAGLVTHAVHLQLPSRDGQRALHFRGRITRWGHSRP